MLALVDRILKAPLPSESMTGVGVEGNRAGRAAVGYE